jgi:hypothetical protein
MGKVRYLLDDPAYALDDGGVPVGPYSYVEGDAEVGPGQPNVTDSPATWGEWYDRVSAPFLLRNLPETAAGVVDALKNSIRTQEATLAGGNVPKQQQGDAAAVLSAFTPAGALAARGAGKVASAARGAEHVAPDAAPTFHANNEKAAPFGAASAGSEAGGRKYYHGSPHDFDKFDLNKVGTGEGAQAYGHGLYFAESENVAKSYRDGLRFQRPKEISTPQDQVLDDLNYHRGNIEGLRSIYQGMIDRGSPEAVNMGREKLALLDEVASDNPGRMYEVNLSAQPEQFLDWDKPFAQQTPDIRNKLSGFGLSDEAKSFNIYQGIVEKLRTDGRISADSDLSAQVSTALREAGVPGVRYLDQESRRDGGSSNYVVFDDSLIDISKKYANNERAAPFSLVVAGNGAAEKGFSPDVFLHGSRNIKGLIDEGAFDPKRFDDDHSLLGGGAYASKSGKQASSYARNDPTARYYGGLRFEHGDGSGVMPLQHRLESPLDLRRPVEFATVAPIFEDALARSSSSPLLGPKPFDSAMRAFEAGQKTGVIRDPDLMLGNLGAGYNPNFVREAIQGAGHDGVFHTGGKLEGTPHEVMIAYPDSLNKLRSPNAKFEDLDVNNLFAANGASGAAMFPFSAGAQNDR